VHPQRPLLYRNAPSFDPNIVKAEKNANANMKTATYKNILPGLSIPRFFLTELNTCC
jgi:hypothetical protein